MPRLSDRNIRCRGIDADDLAGRGHGGDSRRQGTRPRSEVQYHVARANSGEFHHEWRARSTPSAHEALVRVACGKHSVSVKRLKKIPDDESGDLSPKFRSIFL